MKEHQSSIFFENLQDRTLRFQGCMSIKTDSGKQYAVSFDREVAPRGKFNETLHFDWTPGSSAQSTLVMMNPVKWKASRSVKKTPPISCELPFRRIFKHQAACFPIHIETKIPEKLAGQLTFNVQVEPDVPVKIGELKNGMLHIDWSQCPPGDYKLKMALVYNNGRIFWELPAEKITLDSHLPYNRIVKRTGCSRFQTDLSFGFLSCFMGYAFGRQNRVDSIFRRKFLQRDSCFMESP